MAAINPGRLKFGIDLLLWLMATLFALAFRNPLFLNQGLSKLAAYLLVSCVIFAVFYAVWKLPRQYWRYVGMPDLLLLGRAALVATLLIEIITVVFFSQLNVPRSVPLVAGLTAYVLMSGVRVTSRLLREGRGQQGGVPAMRRVLIVGAGEAGTLIAREMKRHPESGLLPLGFVDDEPSKAGRTILGLPIFGKVDELAQVAKAQGAEEVLIAVPSASGDFIRHVVDLASSAELKYRIIPGVYDILSGNVTIDQIREVDLEDLLRRTPVKLNIAEIAHYLTDRIILVTGAGGSIGSEIVRQIIAYNPKQVILFGRGENSIFSIQQEITRAWPEVKHIGLIGDVRDYDRLKAVFRDYQPQVVFHAAAHKHVPLMEQTPSEAILNNVVGTQNVVELCLEHGVERLVNVSTDKAVNPTSVMGASKRVAEMIVSAGAVRSKPDQAFVSVRFGNVLGSRGSVVPTFMAQIRAGGPITVTHPEMVRYFMTIPEAARLVLQAGGLAESGKVYVLNMGDPVKIADLARDVIHLSGAKDVDIVFSGVRPGEKLYEELLTSSEGTSSTTHSEIFSANLAQVEPALLKQQLDQLIANARAGNYPGVRADLAEMIPENKFGSLT